MRELLPVLQRLALAFPLILALMGEAHLSLAQGWVLWGLGKCRALSVASRDTTVTSLEQARST